MNFLIKICSIGLFLIVCFLNLFQEKFKFAYNPKLKGSYEITEALPLTLDNWLNCNFQETFEKSMSINYGLSNRFIYYKNYVDYKLFDKLNAKETVLGKNDFLYEISYINAYTGTDCLGKDSIDHLLKTLKVIQDSLQKRKINLLLVFSPGKASFYPEFIPDRYMKNIKESNNLKLFHSFALKHGLNFLDLTEFFINSKDTCHYPLFVNTGIHWTEYGDALVTIELNKYLKRQLNYPQNQLRINNYEISDTTKGRDGDIAEGLNLPFKFKTPKLLYPNLETTKNEISLPNSIVIGDSYFWGIFAKGYSSLIFNNCEFWYYNKIIHHSNDQLTENANTANLTEKLKSNNLIVIIATEATLKKFGWGVIERLHNYVKHPEIEQKAINEYKLNVERWRKYILTDKNWIKDASIRAKEKKITLDSSITLDAMYQTEINNKAPNL